MAMTILQPELIAELYEAMQSAGMMAYPSPQRMPVIFQAPPPRLLVIGGPHQGQFHRLRSDERDLVLRSQKPATVRYDPTVDTMIASADAYAYRRAGWRAFVMGEPYEFEYLAPRDWGDERVVDHLTGGKYGSDRLPRPKAQSHPGKTPDSGDTGRTVKVAVTLASQSSGLAIDTVVAVPDAGIRTGEITGWRCWALRVPPILHSTFMELEAWRPDEPMKGDTRVKDQGVHAFKHPLSAAAYMAEWLSDTRPQENVIAYVFGSVDLYGEVLEHEIGYRAEFARVASVEHVFLVGDTDFGPTGTDAARAIFLETVRRFYGVAPGPRA